MGLRTALVLGATIAVAWAASAAVPYNVVFCLPGYPNALNSSGQVVGREGGYGAVVWDMGRRTALAYGTNSEAWDINDAGYIVATGIHRRSVLWKDGAVVADIDSWSGKAVNNQLQVLVGSGIWEDGEITATGFTSGADINDAGQVVGNDHPAALLWDDGMVTEVGPEGAIWSQALGMNDSGQVVGYARMALREFPAFFWDGTESIVLDTLGGHSGWANAVNEQEQIVGWSDTEEGEDRACLWEDGEVFDLNDLLVEPLDWSHWSVSALVSAVDINDSGQIACRAEDLWGHDWAVLLSPVPEPSALLLLWLGAGVVLRKARQTSAPSVRRPRRPVRM